MHCILYRESILWILPSPVYKSYHLKLIVLISSPVLSSGSPNVPGFKLVPVIMCLTMKKYILLSSVSWESKKHRPLSSFFLTCQTQRLCWKMSCDQNHRTVAPSLKNSAIRHTASQSKASVTCYNAFLYIFAIERCDTTV